MAHFAELNSSNIVINVLKVENVVITDENNKEQESYGIAFLKGLFGSDKIYKQTSYNCNFRKNYARIGDTYDTTRDAFITNQPFPSWPLMKQLVDMNHQYPTLTQRELTLTIITIGTKMPTKLTILQAGLK